MVRPKTLAERVAFLVGGVAGSVAMGAWSVWPWLSPALRAAGCPL